MNRNLVLVIELEKKNISKLMIPITLFEKFSSYTFITSFKVIYMSTHSSKYYKLRNIHSIPVRGTTWNIAIQKGKIYIKIKVITFIINFRGNTTVKIDRCKSKKEASVSEVLALFNCSSGG